jgi:hypothetical protein
LRAALVTGRHGVNANWFSPDVKFFIGASDFAAAAAGLRAAGPQVEHEWADSDWDEDVVGNLPESLEPREVLQQVFERCGWNTHFDAGGNLSNVYIDRWGISEQVAALHTASVFSALGHYVREGSYVQVVSSDGIDVVYHFRGGRCVEVAKVDLFGERRALVDRDVHGRVRAYLEASGEEGRALATELERATSGQ